MANSSGSPSNDALHPRGEVTTPDEYDANYGSVSPRRPGNQEQTEQPITKNRPQYIKVDNLSPASVAFNLIVSVGEIKPIMNRLNLDGTRLRISEAMVGDSSGAIILSLRNDQIPMVREGDALILRNAKIDMVSGGYMRVAIDRWGLIEPINAEQFSEQINIGHNLSSIEYELVKDMQHNNS